MSKLRIDWLEEEYNEMMATVCGCNVEEDGCTCQSFCDWLEDLESSEAYYACEDLLDERLA
jgi:hypothetical protein